MIASTTLAKAALALGRRRRQHQLFLPLLGTLRSSPPSPAGHDVGFGVGVGRPLSTSACHHPRLALFQTTVTARSLVESVRKRVGWMRFPRARMAAASVLLYESVVDNFDYVEFFAEFDMPDTLYSWYLVSELHVWMLCVRLLADEGYRDEGTYMRSRLLEFFWEDLENRLKALSGISASVRRQHMSDVFEQFQAALFLYDEGVLGDDIRLANALWRRLLDSRAPDDPGKLEALVAYVRRTVRALDSVPFEDLVRERKFKWLRTPRSLTAS